MTLTRDNSDLKMLCGGQIRTRFAPSPTGLLHLGHTYSALTAWQAAEQQPAQFHLRIDDLDVSRCKPEFTEQILKDLTWLGIRWQEPVIYQSHRTSHYMTALQQLQEADLVYPCFLSRKEADRLLSAPHEDEQTASPAPSTRHLLGTAQTRKRQQEGMAPVWRLDSRQAVTYLKNRSASSWPLYWQNHEGQKYLVAPEAFGDVVLARRDSPSSYHLSTVIDDAKSGITLVVRGADLVPVTQIHRLLQAVLGLPTPIYWHHPLIKDDNGQRLAKRHDALSLKTLREQGRTPAEIIAQLPVLERSTR